MTALLSTITGADWRQAIANARTTVNDVAQQIRARLAPRMQRRCAWCKTCMPSVPCLPEQHGTVSDGMCAECFAREMAALDQFSAGSGSNNTTVDGRVEPLPADSLGLSVAQDTQHVSAVSWSAAETPSPIREGEAHTVIKATDRSVTGCESEHARVSAA